MAAALLKRWLGRGQPDAPPPSPEPAARVAKVSDFDEAAYLAAHPDVGEAVANGAFASGEAHYEQFGRTEGRVLALRIARNVEELDVEMERLRKLSLESVSLWLRARATFTYEEDVAALPADPLSPEFRDSQLALYGIISGQERYDPWEAEPHAIDVASGGDPSPYPFSSRDGELIAGHLFAVGHIMQVLWQSKPGVDRTVLEYGCGMGVTTVMLAAAGYRVTAVDINADSIGVVDNLAAGRKLDIRTHCGEFGDVPVDGERFEIILFYEAFHHCLDFVALLRKLHDRLTDDGILVFAGEPIYQRFPKPWGLRLDGASLWEIRMRHWLELGFREDFFRDVLARTGWSWEKRSLGAAPDIHIARRMQAARDASAAD